VDDAIHIFTCPLKISAQAAADKGLAPQLPSIAISNPARPLQ
jgi:hypothetical protein